MPKQYIETGTYRGDSAIVAAGQFERVQTIELSPYWFEFSKNRLKPFPNVLCHLGDSVKVLPTLLQENIGPTYFFLDAHFAGGTTALGEKEVPLMEELELVVAREQNDILVIDDLRLIGEKGKSGEKGNEVYPEMQFDWTDLTVQDIRHLLMSNAYSIFQYMDRLYAYRNLSFIQARVIGLIFSLSDYLKGAIGK